MGTFCKRKYGTAITACLLIPAFLFAQQKTYSLSQLVEAARLHLPSVMQKMALVNSAKAGVADIKHSFLPQLKVNEQLNIGSDNSIAGGYMPLGVAPSVSAGIRAANNLQPATGNLAVLYSEYELVNFGLNDAKIKNAEAYVGLQQANLQRELYVDQLNIARLYFNLQKTQYKLNADKQNVDRYDSIFKVIRALTLSGIKPGADSSLAKAELSRTKIIYNQTQGNINNIKEQLAYFTGINAVAMNIDSSGNRFTADWLALLKLPVDTVNNPLIDYYAKRKNIYLANETLISKSYLPKILIAGSTWARGSSIQYNDDYQSLGTGFGYQRFNYMAGIAITYDLFNGVHKKDKLLINRFDALASDYDLQQQKLALNSASRQANNNLYTIEANLLELPVQLKSADDTYRQKLAQYKAGIITLIDLTNASFVLYRSQTDYIETLSDWYLAQLDKAAANGSLDQFIQTIK